MLYMRENIQNNLVISIIKKIINLEIFSSKSIIYYNFRSFVLSIYILLYFLSIFPKFLKSKSTLVYQNRASSLICQNRASPSHLSKWREGRLSSGRGAVDLQRVIETSGYQESCPTWQETDNENPIDRSMNPLGKRIPQTMHSPTIRSGSERL